MPVIKVWCLPGNLSEEELRDSVHRTIVEAVVSVSEVGCKDENDMTVLFPSDLMEYGLGSDIFVEITGPFGVPTGTSEVRYKLAARVGSALQGLYPEARIRCSVKEPNPGDGFWSSGMDVR